MRCQSTCWVDTSKCREKRNKVRGQGGVPVQSPGRLKACALQEAQQLGAHTGSLQTPSVRLPLLLSSSFLELQGWWPRELCHLPLPIPLR